MGLLDKIYNAIRPTSPVPVAGGPNIDFMEVREGGKVVRYERGNHREAYYGNAYRACALAKARPLASLPVHVFERKGGVRVEAGGYTANDLSRLLRTRWNPFMTAQEGFRWLDMTKDAKGNAFARVEWSGSRIVAIWPLSGKPEVRMTPAGGVVFKYSGDKFTPAGNYLSREMVWVKSPILDDDGLMGVSLAQLAARELGLSIDIEEFYSKLITNGNHFPGWLETDQKMDDQGMELLKKQLDDGSGIVNAGKLRIFDRGMRYHNTGYTMVDMSLVEQEKWILQQTCRTLSVPPQEVFDLSNATYSNIEQGALNFANKTLVPECAEIERAFSCVLWDAGITDAYVQFDLNGLLRGNYKDRMEGYRIGLYSGFYCPNDIRAKEDMPPYEGGELFLRPTAYATIDPETGEAMYPTSEAQQGTGGSGEDPDGGQALNAIHEDMRARIAARLNEGGDTEKLRDFATRVLTPYANACTLARIEYDIQADIEEIVAHEGH